VNLPAALLAVAFVLSASVAAAEDSTAPTGTAPVQPPKIAAPHTMPPGAYPLMSTTLGEEGNTTLRFTINADGSVSNPVVVKSSGSPRLDEAAIEGVKTWRYVPAMQNGKPVSVPWVATVSWRLQDTPEEFEAEGFAMLQASAGDVPSDTAQPSGEHMTLLSLQLSNAGKILSVHVVRSSGDPKLDTAAVKLARTRVKPKAAEIDGASVATLVPLVVIWPNNSKPASR
jgi:TonB family protein